jgi:hypothetical protein
VAENSALFLIDNLKTGTCKVIGSRKSQCTGWKFLEKVARV